jgi:hypothetical protein
MTAGRGNAPGRTPEALTKNVPSTADDLTSGAPTWADLVAGEPRLAMLEAEVELANKMAAPRCCNLTWYGRGSGPSLKRRYSELIGWGRSRTAAGPAWLRSSAAFEAGYEHLYGLLACDYGADGSCECAPW